MLTLAHLTKSFGATRAIDDVSLEVRSGDIVGIVGENGAGKTTLMRIIAGELAPDSGRVRVEGRAALVHQHFMLVSNFTVAENLALAATEIAHASAVRGLRSAVRFLRTPRALERDARAIIAATGIHLPDVSRCVDELSVGERAKLELIKAIARKPDILILDEPTAVLTPNESAELFGVMQRLAAGGTAVLFISHKLREVLEVASRIVVMRAGKITAKTASHGMSAEDLAAAMVASTVHAERSEASSVRLRETAHAAQTEPKVLRSAQDRLRLPALRSEQLTGDRLRGATFDVAAGEIVAIVGVAGNGQVELAAMLRGIVAPRSGRILFDGRGATARQLLRTREIGHIPEDRTREGVVAQMSIAENIALNSRAPLRQSHALAAQLIDLYSIRARSASQPAVSLSGGNQQKVLLARVLDRRPAVIVAAEPARGLDIAATRFVHEQLRLAAAAGSGILLITSDLDEAFTLADAMHVIYRGSLSARLTPSEAASQVANLMAGVA